MEISFKKLHSLEKHFLELQSFWNAWRRILWKGLSWAL